MNRKAFLQSLLGASAFLTVPFRSYGEDSSSLKQLVEDHSSTAKGNMYGYKDDPIPKVKVALIGLGNRGKTLMEMFRWLVEHEHAEIVALADIDASKLATASEKLQQWQNRKPKKYTGSEDAWKKACTQDNVDLVLIATPWEWHTPMSIFAMEQGKHAATEVPAAYTLTDCWALIEVAERTQRHCIMLENCCYNDEELFVLHMIENGVFGDITHAEGAYLHDLRKHMLSEDYYQDQWRLKHHIHRDGNFYTTHGLGPIAFYLKIGRGDKFSYLTSMSSRERNLSETAIRQKASYTKFRCGDMNSTMLKTAKGKSVLLQFDVHTGRPYSRINKVVGTKAVHDGYPSRLYMDKEELAYWGHQWLDDKAYQEIRAKYTHPMIHNLKSISQDYKQGHGGMDFVMIYRLIRCLNLGLPLDISVYDSVLWSAITPLSELSVQSQSLPVPIPDFTGGKQDLEGKLEIMRDI